MMGGYGNGYSGYGGYSDMMGGGWLGGALFLFFGILIFVGVVMLVIWAVRSSHRHGAAVAMHRPVGAVGHDEAIAIAKRRFASGEIDKTQYDEIVRSLNG